MPVDPGTPTAINLAKHAGHIFTAPFQYRNLSRFPIGRHERGEGARPVADIGSPKSCACAEAIVSDAQERCLGIGIAGQLAKEGKAFAPEQGIPRFGYVIRARAVKGPQPVVTRNIGMDHGHIHQMPGHGRRAIKPGPITRGQPEGPEATHPSIVVVGPFPRSTEIRVVWIVTNTCRHAEICQGFSAILFRQESPQRVVIRQRCRGAKGSGLTVVSDIFQQGRLGHG